MASFDPLAIDPGACVAASRRFAVPRFQQALRDIVEEVLDAGRAPILDARPGELTTGS